MRVLLNLHNDYQNVLLGQILQLQLLVHSLKQRYLSTAHFHSKMLIIIRKMHNL